MHTNIFTAADYNQINILHLLNEGNLVIVSTANNVSIKLKKGIFVPDINTFKLIDIATDIIKANDTILNIADIGSGSGVIAISLAHLFPNKLVHAYETSSNAYNLLIENIKLNNTKNIKVYLNNRKDWIDLSTNTELDFIISNPPYTGNREYNSDQFLKNYPDYKSQPKQAIRTYDSFGISPYIKIMQASNSFNTKHFLFQCNSHYIDMLYKKIDTKFYNVEKIKDVGNYKFIFIQKKLRSVPS